VGILAPLKVPSQHAEFAFSVDRIIPILRGKFQFDFEKVSKLKSPLMLPSIIVLTFDTSIQPSK
jgi:hypothetical protein